MALRDDLAADAHQAWIDENLRNGCTTAISRLTGEEQMVPFDELSDTVKEYDYKLVDVILASLKKRDYLLFGPAEETTEIVRFPFDPDDYPVR